MNRTIDITPTWAALMPAFIAALQNGTGDGPRIAAEELARLAASVDAMNARARAKGEAAAETPRPSMAGLSEGRAQGREQAALDLARAAEDFATAGQIGKAAAYLEAACRIAPARLELVPDWKARADSWVRDLAQAKGEAAEELARVVADMKATPEARTGHALARRLARIELLAARLA